MQRATFADLSYRWVVGLLAGVAIQILVAPVVIVITTSFTTSQALRFPPPGLSLRWYQELFDPVRSAPIHVAAWNSVWVAFFATTGVILSAGYALWLYRRVVFGKLEKASLKHITDMTPREAMALVPLILLTIFFGVYPAPILDVFGASVESLMAGVNKSLAAAGAITAAGL